MRPAHNPLNPILVCPCGWRGLRLSAVHAAPNPSGTFIAGCPQCQKFHLRPER
jgi:hypothetical protein